MPNESIEQQSTDSDMIFGQVTSGDFDTFEQARQLIVMLYVPDMSISRAGIAHALKRLERHYAPQVKHSCPACGVGLRLPSKQP